MYHISRNKSKVKPFSVVNLSESGEVLSDHRLKTKQACFKNLVAVMDNVKIIEGDIKVWVNAQDDTVKSIIGYKIYNNGNVEVIEGYDPKPRYIAGKNPTRKKT
jgi:hypothetical protein